MPYKDITPPAGGKISIDQGKLTVPDNPVIPFIRGGKRASLRRRGGESVRRSKEGFMV